ncbi:MAG: xanthine dehydrogenase family protein subunit M [Chloroflexota bacterium]|nr:xanthine dehydrogenase family protein subunit M [Chloroflexota bacterium]
MFEYARPTSLDETFSLLAEVPDARVLCGGTDLLVGLRKGTIRPPLVIDLKAVAELRPGIECLEQALRISATTVLTDIVEDERVQRHFPALVEGALVVGSIQIRNRATLAGNMCNASPAADTAPPLLVYGAVLELRGPSGTRRVPLTDFFLGPGRTVRGPAEVVTAVELPLPLEPVGAAFGRMTRRRGVDLATVNLCCSVSAEGVTKFAYGAVGPRPFLVSDETGTLADPAGDPARQAEVLRALASHASPISNVRASREYRQAMLLVLSRRALERARNSLRLARRAI